jgi:hypothetical protein
MREDHGEVVVTLLDVVLELNYPQFALFGG